MILNTQVFQLLIHVFVSVCADTYFYSYETWIVYRHEVHKLRKALFILDHKMEILYVTNSRALEVTNSHST